MRIGLLGYRCTGKTSVGRALAERLGIAFWDADEELEARWGKSVREIIEEGGWELFRVKEREVTKELLALDPALIALGGGAVLDPRTRRELRSRGVNVWLAASPTTILERMAHDPKNPSRRPALGPLGPEEEVRTLLRERESLYEEVAHFKVVTDHKSVEEIVGEILLRLSEGSSNHSSNGSG
ncbi:MAG: shikimate kinase [Thermodesulfobacteriota bacterium]